MAAAQLGYRTPRLRARARTAPAAQVGDAVHPRRLRRPRGAARPSARPCDVVTYEFENVAARRRSTRSRRSCRSARAGARSKWRRTGSPRSNSSQASAARPAPYRRGRRPGRRSPTRSSAARRARRSSRPAAPATTARARCGSTPAPRPERPGWRRRGAVGARGLRRLRARVLGDPRARHRWRGRRFDPAENVHRDGILLRTRVPAPVPAAHGAGRGAARRPHPQRARLRRRDRRSSSSSPPPGSVVNEIAPRVHNSGHWTEGACVIDQFEQHVRAICGCRSATARASGAEMVNLIGDAVGRRARRSAARTCTSTARPRRGPGARWAT